LNNKGIDTLDGTQVPPGTDWRKFYFPALKKATILLPVLSANFMFSRACETEITYAVDKRKKIIPILCDENYMHVLDRPEDYAEKDEDIEMRAPKLEVFLSDCNRVPANGPFDQQFEANAENLYQQILASLEQAGVPIEEASGTAVDAITENAEKKPWDTAEGSDDATRIVNYLKKNDPETLSPDDQKMHTVALLALNVILNLPEDMPDPDKDMCAKVMQESPEAMLAAHIKFDGIDKEMAVAAMDLLRTLCMPGGHFGAGLLEFRDRAAKAGCLQGLVQSLRHDQPKEVKHSALVAINYISRFKETQIALVHDGHIPTFIAMVNDPQNSSVAKRYALATLWNVVTQPANKKQMMDNGIIQTIPAYISDPKRNEEGQKSCYFITSHLSYAYPVEVNECGIVEDALHLIYHFSTPLPPSSRQTIEGACRLMETIALSDKTRASLVPRGAVKALLYALGIETIDAKSKGDATTDSAGAPRDACKMRAAKALQHLVKDKSINAAKDALIELLDKMVAEKTANENILLWLAVQPDLKPLLMAKPSLMQVLQSQITNCTPALAMLLFATVNNIEEFERLLDTKRGDGQDLATIAMSVFTAEGHSMCAWWATLVQCMQTVQKDLHLIKRSEFWEQLMDHLFDWMGGGHPFKMDPKFLLQFLITTDQKMFDKALSRVLKLEHKISAETKQGLRKDPSAIAPKSIHEKNPKGFSFLAQGIEELL
jgi:hypothetical protein